MDYEFLKGPAGFTINGKLFPAERVVKSKTEVIETLVENELTYYQSHCILNEIIEELERKMGNLKVT